MLDKNEIEELPFFSGISKEKLEQIIPRWDLLEFQTNEIIFHQGDIAKNLYGVLDGEVVLSVVVTDKIYKADVEFEEAIHNRLEIIEKPIVVDTVGSREVFGWSSLVSPGRWTATARCSRVSKILSISAADLNDMFDKDPELGYILMCRLNQIISSRLQKRTDKLVETWVEAFDIDRV